ncbi:MULTISPECIES: hypothetical protein [Mycobacteriaceae]|uniref:hypothetical protein n=1 Tax=Mycobacteriaceae TaxID=1762 RepID=UPI0007FD657C|nr:MULTISPECIES: hypothetical protein [Mycobacteriaceae]MCK0172964.1 hypothetical protein [Mycolicibacterium sp. F2034L]OBB57893.1 hypothetical protein A5757_18895 [Mycobacterium sp. 852013-51886_SCH5428379]
MAAVITRPLSDSSDSLLRFAMRADATVCAGVGLLVAMTADPLARLTGVSATAAWLGGAALVAYGAVLYVLAAVSRLRRIGVALVVANTAFAVGATVGVTGGAVPLTSVGAVLVLAFAAVTAALAWLQYLGVRRLA